MRDRQGAWPSPRHERGSVTLARILCLVWLLAVLPAVVRAAEEVRIPVPFQVQDLERVSDAEGAFFRLSGARSPREPGVDGLPRASFSLRIPGDRRVRSARLVGAVAQLIEGEGRESIDPLAPSITIAGESWWHGERLVHLYYDPLQQRAGGESLILWEGGEIVLELEPHQTAITVARREREGVDQAQARLSSMRAVLSNGSDLPRPLHPLTSPLSAAKSPAKPSELSSKAPSLDTGPYRYLVITTSDLVSSFQPLVDFREQQGLPGIVVSVEEIQAVTRQGLDLAETIRYYLRDAYERWAVDYVLLGGDTELIPTRFVSSTYYLDGELTEVPVDMYFAGLDGNWNADGDALYGEPYRTGADPGDFADLVPELAVGRAPVRDIAEATVFVNKVLHYESGVNGDRFARALFASEVLFPQDWTPGVAVIRDGAVFSERIAYTVQQWGEGSWELLKLYQNYTAYPDSEEETRVRFSAELDAGQYGLVHHIGHGFYYNMSMGDENFLVSHADALSNGDNSFVIMALNCDSAAYDVNCLLERFLRNPNGGSVASIGSSRAAFDNTTNEYQQALYRVIFQGKRQRLGDAILESRLGFVPSTFFDTVDRWTQLVFTLLGDPAMRMWTGAPQTPQVSAPSRLPLGTTDFEVVVRNGVGAPVDSAAVVLTGGENQLVAAWTAADGRVRIPLPAGQTGAWQLHVNGRNLLPSSRSLIVDPAPAGHLSLAGLDLDDSAGNDNGRAEAGETLRLTAVLRNGGTSSVGAGTVQLQVDDPWITLIQGSANYSAMLPGDQASATAAFELTVSSDAPDRHLATLRFQIDENGGDSWVDAERLEIAAAVVEILVTRIDDSAGNGDGIVDPGEDVSLIVTLKNYGGARVDGVVASLSSSDPAVIILDGDTSWGPMDGVLSSADNLSDPLLVRETNTASPHLYRLAFLADDGASWELEFDLRAPSTPEGLSSGTASTRSILLGWNRSTAPDLKGYRMERRIEGAGAWTLLTADLLRGGAVYLDEGLNPLTRYQYRVITVDAFGLESAPSTSLLVSTPPPEISCFPLPMAAEVTGASAVGHLDADGVPDLVVGSQLIYVIDGNCEEKLDGDQDGQTLGPIHKVDGSFHQAGVSVGNLDGVGYEEIVASNWETRELYVYDGNGQLLPGWPITLAQNNWSTPVLGDLDLDGDLEIVVNDIAGWTYAFHHDGTEVADGDGDPASIGPIAPRRDGEWFGRTTPALLDVTGDGKPEILFGSAFGGGADEFFYALMGDGGGNAPNWPKNLGPGASFLASPAVGDVDNDGGAEIVASSENDSLYVWNADGSPMRDYPIRLRSRSGDFESQAPSCALVDFEGDGLLEIVAVSVDNFNEAYIHIFDVDGQERAGWPQQVPGLSESNPVVADLDGDGSLDIVFGIGGGADFLPSLLYVFHSDGTAFGGFPIRMDAWVRATPTLCDFNLDGRANLVLASWDLLIHVWDMGGSYDSNLAPWPSFHGNSHRDGRAVSLGAKRPTITLDSAPPSPPVLQGNHPNPFNPRTVIRFTVPEGGARGELSVYDSAGRRVRTLLQGRIPGGTQSVRWDGTDARGAEVASGVYFARLSLEGNAPLSRKMALLR